MKKVGSMPEQRWQIALEQTIPGLTCLLRELVSGSKEQMQAHMRKSERTGMNFSKPHGPWDAHWIVNAFPATWTLVSIQTLLLVIVGSQHCTTLCPACSSAFQGSAGTTHSHNSWQCFFYFRSQDAFSAMSPLLHLTTSLSGVIQKQQSKLNTWKCLGNKAVWTTPD